MKRVKTEFEGKNIQAAVAKACKKLKVEAENLKYEIISHGSSGIFGFGGVKKAKIRIKTDNSVQKSVAVKRNSRTTEKKSEPSKQIETPVSNEDPIDIGENLLTRIIKTIGSNAQITVNRNSERVDYKVSGENAGILIGKKGQTLEAIQLLVEKAVNKQQKNRIRIQVDIEDYLRNRRESLRGLAKKLSEKAKRLKKPMSLGEMNAVDRRTIHLALKDDPGVRTVSRGTGYIKKIVIFPKD